MRKLQGNKKAANVTESSTPGTVSKRSSLHHPEFERPATIHQTYGRDFKDLVQEYKLYQEKLRFYSRLNEIMDHQQFLRETPPYYWNSHPMSGQHNKNYSYTLGDYHSSSPYFLDQERDRPRFVSVDRHHRLRTTQKLEELYKLHAFVDRI